MPLAQPSKTNNILPDPTVLAVNLDGTLLRTDSLLESLFALLRERPLALGSAALSLRRGRAAFKARIADKASLDIDTLPLNSPVVEWLYVERAAGRRLMLVTAADQRIAKAIAARTGLFDEIIASNGARNLKSENKAVELVARFGQKGFDYVGNSYADLPVWRAAHRAIIVGDSQLEQAASHIACVERVFRVQRFSLSALMRALRPHQWVKNLLIFLPLLAAHRLTDVTSFLQATLAFLAFSLTASAVYVLNDLLDLPADRRHPRKRHRPFACGELSLTCGLVLTPVLLIGAFSLSQLCLPRIFVGMLCGYVLLTSAYSFKIKRLPILDVMTLAGLYTIRVIAGAAAVSVLVSFWLLAFSMFIFLSLALSKRFTELKGLLQRGELTASGRGWHVDDLPIIGSLGVASGVGCVLVLALYINSGTAQRLYATPEALWLICPLLLYWISRLWFKTHRGAMHDDPVVFALRDCMSLIIGLLIALIAALAIVGVNL